MESPLKEKFFYELKHAREVGGDLEMLNCYSRLVLSCKEDSRWNALYAAIGKLSNVFGYRIRAVDQMFADMSRISKERYVQENFPDEQDHVYHLSERQLQKVKELRDQFDPEEYPETLCEEIGITEEELQTAKKIMSCAPEVLQLINDAEGVRFVTASGKNVDCRISARDVALLTIPVFRKKNEKAEAEKEGDPEEYRKLKRDCIPVRIEAIEKAPGELPMKDYSWMSC